MTTNYDKLKEKLKEIFQLDQADLDFGIYRVLNTKAEEVERYLDEDLKKQVADILSTASTDDLADVKEQIAEIEQQAKKFKADPNDNPDYIDLKERLAGSIDIDALEKDIFSDLYNFFNRYYEGGDFLSLRRYKEGVYAIPYEGEEVKLHWANSDQYYIKTSEYFSNYSFKLADGKRIHFRLVKAGTEQNNNKAQQGKDRRFILSTAEEVRIEDDELVIPFEYKPDSEKRTQKVINEATVKALRSNKVIMGFAPDLLKEIDRASGGKWTSLEKYLNDYTAKNEFDYFIHKDLGGFMRRELDFFIKNEVLYLDDMIDQKPKDFEKRLAKLKALKTIGHKIIDFLAQLEEFQKKLWLKKKFVVETNWCITLDRVPEELYADIAANDAQREAWVRLFAINDLKGYAKKLTVQFLKDNPCLVLDTAFFTDDFKVKLLSSIENIDEQTDGVLVHSENFQAINFLDQRYKESLKCIYIDPPYNTSASEIVYKNSYKHSSWLSLMEGRVQKSINLLDKRGQICIAIDDSEYHRLYQLVSNILDEDFILGTAVVRSNPAGRSTARGFSVAHEYLIFAGRSEDTQIGRLKRSEKQLSRYKEKDEEGVYEWVNFRKHGGANANRSARAKLFYPIYGSSKGLRIPEIKWDEKAREWVALDAVKADEAIIYPVNAKGEEKTWKWGHETARKKFNDLMCKPDQTGGLGVYCKARMNEEGSLPVTLWDKKEYSATDYGTNYITHIFGDSQLFSFPKSIHAVEDSLRVMNIGENGVVLDYFAGSATTGHAVINLNREDDGERKYILVEMGEYFDAVTKPRMQKAIYSRDWKDGKPVSREGISQCFKYIRLESYEDALNNLVLERSDDLQAALDDNENIKEQYLLHYMLDTESKGSVLDLKAFEKPFDYQLLINRDDDTRKRKIDLVETFNYLIGLYVEQMRFIDDVYVINGKTHEGDAVLILWRDAETLDASKLDKWFEDNREALNPSAYSTIYVNGDNTLQGQAGKGDNWSMKLIEEAFHRLMFNETSL